MNKPKSDAERLFWAIFGLIVRVSATSFVVMCFFFHSEYSDAREDFARYLFLAQIAEWLYTKSGNREIAQ